MEKRAADRPRRSRAWSLGLLLLYGSTIFLSAFLLFQVQPLIGKVILPWFGGSAAVWSTCLLFFQSLLVAGYLYAHLLVRWFSPRSQAVLHIALLAISLALLPIVPDPSWKPDAAEDPTLLIVGLLSVAVGFPYFLLSTSGPLLQAWFSREKSGAVPYRLFALSNFGSMLGLLSYPLLFEPAWALADMSSMWSIAYALFALLAAALAVHSARGNGAEKSAEPEQLSSPTLSMMALWASLAACATVFLMSVSSHLTQNVAPVPLLWVLPLAIYLLSFILCFDGGRWYSRGWFLPLFLLWLPVAAWDLVMRLPVDGALLPVALYCAGLFLACMLCHGELASIKPVPAQLTTFYLMIATGGALGGSFIVLIAPRVFNADYELPLVAVLTALIGLSLARPTAGTKLPARSLTALVVLFTGVIAILVTVGLVSKQREYLLSTRNFYGTLKVAQRWLAGEPQHELVHGAVVHGSQYLSGPLRHRPTTYYGKESGAGLAIFATRNEGPQRVGVIGLGAGTMAVYGRRGDTYRFYEINPAVERLANSQFSYLTDTPARVELAIGDARLSMEREKPQQFDVLAVDAFSGDSIPVHLLTREAFEIYLKHLRRGGVLAVHVSNRNLELGPVVQQGVAHYGCATRLVESDTSHEIAENNSSWVLVARDERFFDNPVLSEHVQTIKRMEPTAAIRPWTDDYSSLFAILK